jgi:hypothetical protein
MSNINPVEQPKTVVKKRKERVPEVERQLEQAVKVATDKKVKEDLTKQLKQKRFKRVIDIRLSKLAEEFKLVSRMFTSSNYEFTIEQAEYVLKAVENLQSRYIANVIITDAEDQGAIEVPA